MKKIIWSGSEYIETIVGLQMKGYELIVTNYADKIFEHLSAGNVYGFIFEPHEISMGYSDKYKNMRYEADPCFSNWNFGKVVVPHLLGELKRLGKPLPERLICYFTEWSFHSHSQQTGEELVGRSNYPINKIACIQDDSEEQLFKILGVV